MHGAEQEKKWVGAVIRGCPGVKWFVVCGLYTWWAMCTHCWLAPQVEVGMCDPSAAVAVACVSTTPLSEAQPVQLFMMMLLLSVGCLVCHRDVDLQWHKLW